MEPVFGSVTATICLPLFVLPVLCAYFFLLLLNDGLAAQVYDRQTLLYIRSSMVDHSALPPWDDIPQSLLSTSTLLAGDSGGGFQHCG